MYDKQHVNYKLHKDIKKTLSKNTSPVAVTFFIFFLHINILENFMVWECF